MVIQNSQVTMQFDHHQVRRQTLTPLAAGVPELANEAKRADIPIAPRHPSSDAFLLSSRPEATQPFTGANLSSSLRVMKLVLENLLGKYIETQADHSVRSDAPQGEPQVQVEVALQSIEVQASGGEVLSYRLRLHESEKATVNIQAEMELRSGRKINVDLEQSVSRRLDLDVQISALEAARWIDPLVLNFGGAVGLSDRRVDFDLSATGTAESIATLNSSSAYLALDKNGDGKINDGSELFGALSGDGFAELAQYDEDGNGFIDAGDSVFSRLQLFNPGGPGDGSLRAIDSAGVEAIYTGSTASPFTLTSASGDVLGRVRSTGFHVGSYGANTAQQIDLAV